MSEYEELQKPPASYSEKVYINPALLNAFKQIDGRLESLPTFKYLASMYEGTYKALSDNENPERFVQAAHSIRELIEKFLDYLKVDEEPSSNYKTKVSKMIEALKSAKENSPAFRGETLSGEIDVHVKKLIEEVVRFEDWHKKARPPRSAQSMSVILGLDPAKNPIPENILKLKVQALKEYREYFQAISHHRKEAIEIRFFSYLESFEEFFLNLLRVRPVSNMKKIDELIKRKKDDD